MKRRKKGGEKGKRNKGGKMLHLESNQDPSCGRSKL